MQTDFLYAPQIGDFRVRQGGRDLSAESGVCQLAKAPFEIRYEGPCDQQAIIAMSSQSLNMLLASKGLPVLWGRAGEGVARNPGDLWLTPAHLVELCSDRESRARFANLVSSGSDAFLEGLIQREPRFQIAMSAPRMTLQEGTLAFDSIQGVPVTSTPDQTIHVTGLAFTAGYTGDPNGKWDWFFRMAWTGFALQFRD